MGWDAAIQAAAEAANMAMTMHGAHKDRMTSIRMARENLAQQKEFAQHGIRWRVNDAKLAGLHPLYAIGAQPLNFSPVHVDSAMGPAMAQAGQSLVRAAQAVKSSYERRAAELQLKLLESQIGESDARKQVLLSEAARGAQAANASAPLDFSEPGKTLLSEGVDIVGQHMATAPTSYHASERDSSIGANVNPLWSRFMVGKNQEMVLPGGISGDAAEALESLAESPILMWMTYKENAARYGERFTDFIFQRYLPDWPDIKFDIGKMLGEIVQRVVK